MSAFGLLMLAGFFFYIAYAIGKSQNNRVEEQKKINLENGIFCQCTLKYGGGWTELSEARDVKVDVRDEEIYITCVRNFKDGNSELPHIIIPYKNIKNVSVKMESEVKSNATLGKILLVGIFAFSKKKVDLSFLIIDYIDEFNSEQSFIFVSETGFSPFPQELNKQRRKCLNNA